MLRNYLKIAVRNLVRHPAYSILSVASLAIGIACCILIALFVEDELSYDRFHENADCIYYVVKEGYFGDEWRRGIGTGYSLLPTLQMTVPKIESATHTTFLRSSDVRRGDMVFYEERNILHADSAFFSVFSFPLVRGNPKTALIAPFSVVLSEEAASKYFGSDDPMGKTLEITGHGEGTTGPYDVTGVASVPANSSITFDFLLSASTMDLNWRRTDVWGSGIYATYFLASDSRSATQIDAALASVAEQHLSDRGYELSSMPLTQLYLSDVGDEGSLRGDVRYVYLFSAIALTILLIASINYMNLATARSGRRSTEVGVRKTVGATRSRLVNQFLVEGVVTALIAFLIALALARLALPFVNDIFGKAMTLSYDGNGLLFIGLVGLSVVVGLISGSYPALYLSSFDPIGIFRRRQGRSRRAVSLRRSLIVLQFATSIALIAVALTTYQQLAFIQNRDLGFDENTLLSVYLPADGFGRYEQFKESFLQIPNVTSVAATSAGVPGTGFGAMHTMRPDSTAPDRRLSIRWANVDSDYLETLGLRLTAGRNFSPERPSDQHAAILNEAAVEALGWSEPIGQTLDAYSDGPQIIGVVEDFHYQSLHSGVDPVILHAKRHPSDEIEYVEIVVRLTSGDVAGTLESVRGSYERLAPDEPFRYYFVEDEIASLYGADHQLGRAFTAAAIIAVLVACLGLFGLAVFAAQNRTKEIAIRKVNGATDWTIVGLLIRETLVLVAISFVIAVPVALVISERWIERFAVQVQGRTVFLLIAGGIALLIAALTVGQQALRAARQNPATGLRYE